MQNKNTLQLTLKEKWFNMTASGIKKEEYREIKPIWCNRFLICNGKKESIAFWKGFLARNIESVKRGLESGWLSFQTYDSTLLYHGYKSDRPKVTLENLGISVGEAIPEWSDNWKGIVFVIKHGNIIS